jgi:hypothetical protein
MLGVLLLLLAEVETTTITGVILVLLLHDAGPRQTTTAMTFSNCLRLAKQLVKQPEAKSIVK